MIYFKSILAGLAAVLVAYLVVIGAILGAVFVIERQSNTGGIGAVSISIGLLMPVVILLAVLAFGAGFLWEFRRASH